MDSMQDQKKYTVTFNGNTINITPRQALVKRKVMEYFYYDDLGQKYYSKFDALRSKREVALYFYDKEFLAFDWKTEPRESLSELYKLRAQQLRDKYDYLILAYSGGIDSTNILETFYYNNIHVDEIIMVGAFSQDSHYGSDENHNGEIYHNCIPTLQMMDLKNTKITYHDYTKLFDTPEKFVSYDDMDKKYIVVDTHFSIHHRWWGTPSFLNNDNNTKKKAIIFGVDKPNFSSENFRHYMSFNAFSVSMLGNHALYEQLSDNITREFFYWTPDMPKILSKQMHMIANFYNENITLKKVISHNAFFDAKYYDNIKEKIIYGGVKNYLKFKSQKSNNILSLRDNYILKKKNSKIYEDYLKQVVWAQNNSSGLVMKHGSYNKNDIWSRKYFIN